MNNTSRDRSEYNHNYYLEHKQQILNKAKIRKQLKKVTCHICNVKILSNDTKHQKTLRHINNLKKKQKTVTDEELYKVFDLMKEIFLDFSE